MFLRRFAANRFFIEGEVGNGSTTRWNSVGGQGDGDTLCGMGLIFGGMIALVSLAGVAMPQQQNAEVNPMAFMLAGGVAALIILPIMYGAMGFVGGIIMAAFYNLVASIVGGLELDFHDGGPEYLQR